MTFKGGIKIDRLIVLFLIIITGELLEIRESISKNKENENIKKNEKKQEYSSERADSLASLGFVFIIIIIILFS